MRPIIQSWAAQRLRLRPSIIVTKLMDKGELGHQKVLLLSMRHTVYLQLASTPVPGVNYTISNSARRVRRFSILLSMIRQHVPAVSNRAAPVIGRSDNFKYAYLCSRLPHGAQPWSGGFCGHLRPQDILHHRSKWNAFCFKGRSRYVATWNQSEAGDGYSAGIDVADLSQSWTVTSVTKGNPTVVTCPGHPFANGDKVRFRGMSGMRQLEGTGATGGAGLWVAATVTVIDANSFSVNIDSRSFSDLTTTDYKPSLGGVLNQVYKCFNTNRAATSVWGMDYSAFQPTVPGEFRIYIPEVWRQRSNSTSTTRPGRSSRRNITKDYIIFGWDAKQIDRQIIPARLRSRTGSTAARIIGALCRRFSRRSFRAIPSARRQGLATVPTQKDLNLVRDLSQISERFNSRPAHQDAGDNDDIGADHLGAITVLAWVFRELPKASRHLPFTVQSSAEFLDPKLFAGTDKLPALFHELAWHLEAYRTQQNADGSAPGGWGLGHFSSQTPNYPEPIQYYRGTDAGGIYAGQTVMAYLYALGSLHQYDSRRRIRQVRANRLRLWIDALGDTYKHAAINAYDWADRLLTNSRCLRRLLHRAT